MMMDAARRRAVETLHRGVRRARGEHPVVAGPEAGRAGGGKAHRHAVLENQRRAGRWNIDQAALARVVQVLDFDRRAARIGAEDFSALVPAPNAQIAGDCERAVGEGRRQHRGRQRRRELNAPRCVDDGDPTDLAGKPRELADIVGDLDPVAGAEAQHVVAAKRLQLELRPRDHARDAAADACVFTRPFEAGAAARLPRIMDFDAIELVFEPTIAAGRRQLARIVLRRDLEGPGREHARRRRRQRAPAGHIGVGRCAGRAGARLVRERAHLPDRLDARGRVHADRALDQIRLFEMRDLAVPHVEIDQMAARRGQRGRIGQVGLGRVADRVGEFALGEQIIEQAFGGVGRACAMVFRKQAVDVKAALADLQRSAGDADLEGVAGGGGDPCAAEHVAAQGAQSAIDDPGELVHVGVEQDTALRELHACIVEQRVEAYSRKVGAHAGPPNRLRQVA